jgi:DNA-binding NarL/FixJ family response regulator
MRILIVDDHPLMADALGLAMSTLDRTTQVEKAVDLASALAPAAGGAFDLCLLDLGLPDCAGLEALTRLRESLPTLPVVVVSANDDAASVIAALDLGAMGFIPKTTPRDVLLGAVRLVAAGGIYVPPQALRQSEAPPAKSAAPLVLSARQQEVLGLLLKGLSNKLIARQLGISEHTAKIHVSAVLRALGVATRTQALIAANRLGLRFDG